MSLARPDAAQMRLAKAVAWERGHTISRMPATSSALAGLISHLKEEYEPLPVEESQLENIAKLTERAEQLVPKFEARRNPIVTRTDGNIELFRLRSQLGKVEFNAAKSAAADYLGVTGDPTDIDDVAPVETEDVPF